VFVRIHQRHVHIVGLVSLTPTLVPDATNVVLIVPTLTCRMVDDVATLHRDRPALVATHAAAYLLPPR